jgi:hypothetical protein
MSPEGNRQVVERYVNALIKNDLDLMAEVCAADVVLEFPQSNERLRGWGNVRAHAENYAAGELDVNVAKVVGSEDKWVLTPSFTALRIEGTGDVYTLLGSAPYPDGRTWQVMALVELRSGKVAKVTMVFGAPFDAPEWRAQWVEPMS